MSFRLTHPIALSFGEEGFFLDRDLDFLRKYPGRDVTVLDGSDVDEGQIVSACEVVSIDFDDPENVRSRLVVVDNGQKVKGEKRLKSFLASRSKSNLYCVLAVICRSDKLSSAWSKIDRETCLVREHKKLKTWDNNNEVAKWAVAEAKQLGFELAQDTSLGLFQITGGDLYRIHNELRKLQLLVGKGKAELSHLSQVASRTSGADPWDVVDAALVKNPKKAMNALNLLYRFASDDPSILLLASLAKGVEKAFLARSMLDRGCQADEVAARLGMHPYRFSKSVQVQAGKHSLKALSLYMQKLSKLDADLKRTSHRRTLVELAVLDVAS